MSTISSKKKEIQIPLSDDILIDTFNFICRKEHQSLNLVDRRFYIISEFVAKRYPPRIIASLLEVSGIRNSIGQFIGNAMSVCQQDDGNSNQNPTELSATYSEIPQVPPPANLSNITELEINDFIGNELLQFMDVSRRLFNGCWLIFTDFDNFIRLHSAQFIRKFFEFFTANHSIELRNVSKDAAHLFKNPEIFGCFDLAIECKDNFDLDLLLDWLYFNGNNGKGRILNIRFSGVHEGKQIEMTWKFMESIAEDFIKSNSARNQFTIEIEIQDGPHIPEIPNLSMENKKTGETMNFLREHQIYSIVRAKKKESDHEKVADEEMGHKSTIYIREMIKGDVE